LAAAPVEAVPPEAPDDALLLLLLLPLPLVAAAVDAPPVPLLGRCRTGDDAAAAAGEARGAALGVLAAAPGLLALAATGDAGPLDEPPGGVEAPAAAAATAPPPPAPAPAAAALGAWWRDTAGEARAAVLPAAGAVDGDGDDADEPAVGCGGCCWNEAFRAATDGPEDEAVAAEACCGCCDAAAAPAPLVASRAAMRARVRAPTTTDASPTGARRARPPKRGQEEAQRSARDEATRRRCEE